MTLARVPRILRLRASRLCHFVLPLVLLLTLPGGTAQSHSPSAWGGLFRSRDQGATWMPVDQGPFPTGAIALALSPADRNHLLLGTETGLLRSRNGGRSWTVEAQSLLLGSVFAVAFAADGQKALIATGRAIFSGSAEAGWQEVPAPRGAAPVRAIVTGSEPGRVYLAGRAGLYRSEDWGRSWMAATEGLPPAPVAALVAVPGSPNILYAAVQDGIWSSSDGARSWSRRPADTSRTDVDTLCADLQVPARLWAAAGERLFRSDNNGATWRRAGQPLPEPNTAVHELAVTGEVVVAATDRGLYRSIDGGEHWIPLVDNLPAHLEAGPLVRDPADPASLYAGFSLIPYSELWQRGGGQEGAPVKINLITLVEGAAVLGLMALGTIILLRVLRTYYPPYDKTRSGMGGRQATVQSIEEEMLP